VLLGEEVSFGESIVCGFWLSFGGEQAIQLIFAPQQCAEVNRLVIAAGDVGCL
jgi:hypothetical protein